MPLPHTLHGWHEAEYVKWVEEHTPAEAWTLVEGGISHWEKLHESQDKDGAMEGKKSRVGACLFQHALRVLFSLHFLSLLTAFIMRFI